MIGLVVVSLFSIGIISKTTGIPTVSYPEFKDVTVLTLHFFILYTISIVILIPIIEEYFWRGYAQGQLTNIFGGKVAIFLQAFLFALLHWYLPLGFILVFINALIFGIWRHKRHSLLPIIIAHMVWNGLWALGHIPFQYEMSKVNITINYVDELNKIGNIRPEEDNAAPYYRQAWNSFVEPTEELDFLKDTLWVNELTSPQILALKKWIELNQIALSHFKQGALKKAYWPGYTDDSMMEIGFSQNYQKVKHLPKALCWNAKLLATEGHIKAAVDELTVCYRLGQHMAEAPKPFISQLMGFGMKGQARYTGLIILDNCNLTKEELEYFRIQFHSSFTSCPSTIDLTAEHLTIMDTIQRLFTDCGNGDGHLPKLERINANSKMIQVLYSGLTKELAEKINESKRKETVEITNTLFEALEEALTKTPFELHEQNIDIYALIQDIAGTNIISLYMSGMSSQHTIFYNTIAQEKALEVILALFQYKIIHNEFPKVLNELVQEDLLTSLPVDPYSDQSFIYQEIDNSFTLYSLGRDFIDDGGDIKKDLLFWPIQYDEKK
ncbi:MAG: CPBP family intramembrane metalloprotease [Deltaproteobacteria bacterium]|nr:CPBP family intramembrane metalloprotease [Deltaproteobacteria bacterium]